MRRIFAVSGLLEFAVALLVILSLSATGLAQAVSGNVVGTVFDSSGAVVTNADVQAVNIATGAKLATKSNASGEYRFNNLPVGAYNVSATGTRV